MKRGRIMNSCKIELNQWKKNRLNSKHRCKKSKKTNKRCLLIISFNNRIKGEENQYKSSIIENLTKSKIK